MDGNRVDPGALLLAVIVVGLQGLTEAGDWQPMNTIISAVVVAVAACFLWPSRGTRTRYLVGFGIAMAFVAGVGLAWPIQATFDVPADAATLWGLGAGAALVATVLIVNRATVRGH